MIGTVEVGMSAPQTRAWLDRLDEMEWKEFARPEDMIGEETEVYLPKGNYMKCAVCGKTFELYTLMDNWAWKVPKTRWNAQKVCCSYTCYTKAKKEAEEEKKNKFPEWRSKRYGKKDTTSEEDI